MRILLISGSLREGSTNTATLRTLCALSPRGLETTVYEGMAGLPREAVQPEVARLREQTHEATR